MFSHQRQGAGDSEAPSASSAALVKAGLPFSNVATSGQPVQRALGTVSYLRRDCVGVRLKGKIGEDGSSITYDFDEEEGSTSSTLRDATEWLTLCEQQED